MQIASSRRTRPMPPSFVDPKPPISPLMLADRLITLAEDADRTGYPDAATALIGLAYNVLDERPLQ